MRVYKWDCNNNSGIAVTAGEESFNDGSGWSYQHSSIWVPATEYRHKQLHIAITPRKREAIVENGRSTLACIGIEHWGMLPCLHVVIEPDEGAS